MSDSRAVAIAKAHVEAWSRRDYDTARGMLAEGVQVTALSTNPALPKTDLEGVDAYMEGLIAFADALAPGSHKVISATGDDSNALLTLTVESSGPPFGDMLMPGSRMYLVDEDGKIAVERVVFYAVPA